MALNASAKLSARKRRQLLGTDQVVGFEAITNLLDLVIQLNLIDTAKASRNDCPVSLLMAPSASAATSRSRVEETAMPFARA